VVARATLLHAPAVRHLLFPSIFLSACVGHPNPDCTGPIGLDGRPLPVCDGVGEVPVCDLSGAPMRATWERNTAGMLVLRNGTLAFCDEVDAVVCTDRTLVPYCLLRPAEE
jgi:hypothetical protein